MLRHEVRLWAGAALSWLGLGLVGRVPFRVLRAGSGAGWPCLRGSGCSGRPVHKACGQLAQHQAPCRATCPAPLRLLVLVRPPCRATEQHPHTCNPRGHAGRAPARPSLGPCGGHTSGSGCRLWGRQETAGRPTPISLGPEQQVRDPANGTCCWVAVLRVMRDAELVSPVLQPVCRAVPQFRSAAAAACAYTSPSALPSGRLVPVLGWGCNTAGHD